MDDRSLAEDELEYLKFLSCCGMFEHVPVCNGDLPLAQGLPVELVDRGAFSDGSQWVKITLVGLATARASGQGGTI